MAQLLKMLPLFNEIEKILDNVNPDDLLEPEVKNTKKGKKRKPKSKENDYSDLEIKETIHHSIKDRSCPECGSLMKELKPTIWMIAQMIIWNMYSIRCVTTLKSWRLYIWMKHHFKSLKTVMLAYK